MKKKNINTIIHIIFILCTTVSIVSCKYMEENFDGADHAYCHAFLKIKNNSDIPLCCYSIQYNNQGIYLLLEFPSFEECTRRSYPLMPQDKYWIHMVHYSCIESIVAGKHNDEEIPEIIICDTFNFSRKPYGIIRRDSTITYISDSYKTEEQLLSNFHVLKRVNINDTSLERLKKTDFTIYYP